MFAGLRAEHGPDALVFAVMEGVAFSFADGVDVLDAAGARPVRPLLVGGGARSEFWGQMIADVTGLTIDLASGAEAGAALGAARLGMLAAGAGSVEAVCARPPVQREFKPDPERAPAPTPPAFSATARSIPPKRRRGSKRSSIWRRRSPIAITRICTPMHMSRKAVSRTMTDRAVAPMSFVRRSAKR